MNEALTPSPAQLGGPRAVSLSSEVGALIALAVPVVAGLIGATSLSVVDSWMLGPLGEIPLAAASLNQSILVIFYACLYGFVGPVGLLAGQTFGTRDLRRGASILKHGLALGLAGGALSSLAMAASLLLLPHLGQPPEVVDAIAGYWLMMSGVLVPFGLSMVIKLFLDSIDRAWTSAVLNLVPVALSVPLNWILIYGKFGLPALGLFGCGIANFLSYMGGLLVMFVYLRFAPSMAPYRQHVAFRRADFRELGREGVPMSIQYLAEGGAVAVAGVLIGLLGATALAANQIVFSVGVLVYMAPLGMAAAVSIRIAQALGLGHAHRVRAIGLAGIGVVTLWMVAFTVAMVWRGEEIARAFVSDPAVVSAAAAIFVAVGLMQVFDGLQSVSLGALRGLLDNRWPTIVSLVAYWLIALPLSAIYGFTLDLGAPGVWAGFGFGLAVAAALLLRRFIGLTAALGLNYHMNTISGR